MNTVTIPGRLPSAPGLSPDNLDIARNHPLASFHKLVSDICLNLNVSKQLHDLRDLQDGWLDGEGCAPPTPGLDWLSGSFAQHFLWNVRPPHIYPTAAGGVQAEWSLGSNEVSLTIDLESHFGAWHELDLETGAVHERTLNCDTTSHWEWLVSRLQFLDSGHA